MRVKIDRKDKSIKLDTTGGLMGPVTSAGHVTRRLMARHGEALKGWNMAFYPETNGRTFNGGVELSNTDWAAVADEIVKLLKVKKQYTFKATFLVEAYDEAGANETADAVKSLLHADDAVDDYWTSLTDIEDVEEAETF